MGHEMVDSCEAAYSSIKFCGYCKPLAPSITTSAPMQNRQPIGGSAGLLTKNGRPAL
jgi:hypothetical protein